MIVVVKRETKHPTQGTQTMANHTTEAKIHENDRHNSAYSATYCISSDKIRLYCGRVERETYNFLRRNKFVATPKQSCDFVAVWSPNAEDIALQMIGEGDDIGDEDTTPEERSIQRAERFAGYRDKRRSEAHGHADTYDAGPNAFGNQNAARAQRAADRHERHRGNALSQWAKAEYWQSRTAGVIDHALHVCDARTRRGRILTIEADLRRCTEGSRWHTHLTNRLAYENAMLANEGGTASEVEMIPGGFIGRHQILKVNRSPITKRVVSVNINASCGFVQVNSQRVYVDHGGVVNIERLGEDAYREPTPEELEAFNGKKAAAPKKPGLINPTLEDAQKLQALWNKDSKKPGTVQQTTQERYTNRSKWSDFPYTTTLFSDGTAETYRGTIREWVAAGKTIVGKLRIDPVLYGVNSIVVLTDKPQKPLPITWPAPVIEQQEAPEQPAALRDESTELEAVAVGCLF